MNFTAMLKRLFTLTLKCLAIFFLIGIVACEKDGPQGPIGPKGDPGNAGPQGDPGASCTVVDNGNGTFTMTCEGASITFGETDEPDAYLMADLVRGGLLYDKFWTVTGGEEPQSEHALYPSFGPRTGSTTWRCKECHGWDYIGKDGRYASGSHYTGIKGLFPATKSLWRAFMIINDDHGYGAAGLTTADIWDLVKFYREGMIDIKDVLDTDGSFKGNISTGQLFYADGVSGYDAQEPKTNISCAFCHGSDGTTEVTPGFDVFVGFLSNDNPQEFLHKVRFGHPGSDPVMPASESIYGSLRDVGDLSAYAQTLSPVPWENTNVLQGGRLYDKYWTVTGEEEPQGEHALYPTNGPRTGNTTWRCKECHGWDYIGNDGRYSSGSHYTGIKGIYPPTLTKWQTFNTIEDDHGYGGTELSDDDIWDLVSFYDAGLFDINFILNTDGTFKGNATNGQTLFENACVTCHGADGLTEVVTGFTNFPGFLSNDNPQEFAHKALYGQPGTLMLGIYDSGATLQDLADLSAYAQTLPQN